jgi:hypothetical protein
MEGQWGQWDEEISVLSRSEIWGLGGMKPY